MMLAVPHTTSPPPSEGSPEASSPPCPPATKAPSASLGTLPYELKEDIVEHLMRSIERDNPHEADQHAVGFFAARDEEGNSTTYAEWKQNAQLRALSFLDRDFSLICLARIYKTVNVQWRDAASLQDFVDDIAPRQAQNVRCLRFNPGKTVLGGFGRKTPIPEAARSELVASVLHCCSSTMELRIDAGLGGITNSAQVDREMAALQRLADAAKNLSSVLQILVIELHDPKVSQVSFIAPSSTLTSLNLAYSAGANVAQSADMSTGLRSLPHLKHLRLDGWRILTDDFLRQSSKAPLESLEFKDSDFSASSDSLHAFISPLRETLTTLSLDLCVENGLVVQHVRDRAAFDLPHLSFLDVSTQFESSSFLHFALAHPLQLLRIGRIPNDGNALEYILELVMKCPLVHLHLGPEAQEEGLRRRFGAPAGRGGLTSDEVQSLTATLAAQGTVVTGVVPHPPAVLRYSLPRHSYDTDASYDSDDTDASYDSDDSGWRPSSWYKPD